VLTEIRENGPMNALELRRVMGLKVGTQTGRLATIVKTLEEQQIIRWSSGGWTEVVR
jgi:hypothetical protein